MMYMDRFCEISSMLQHLAHEPYYGLEHVPTVPGAVYVVGREQMRLNADRIRTMVDKCTIVFSNPAEGSETMRWHLKQYGIEDLVLSGKIKLISGGRMPPQYNQMKFEHFLTQPLRFEENLRACERTPDIFSKTHKPYSFLCLNGRSRPHRRALLLQLEQQDLLNRALWTNLHDHLRPVRLLPPQYEVERYSTNIDCHGFVKPHLFNNEWGEIYIKPELYVDTYFSLVTETVYDYPWSFFTEKIAKPLTIGHPFVAVANAGFYRDLRDLGFRTFNTVIDESFDTIDSGSDRIERIVSVVKDLCSQDLDDFMQAVKDICVYNQHHLKEFAAKQMRDLPVDFLQYVGYQSN